MQTVSVQKGNKSYGFFLIILCLILTLVACNNNVASVQPTPIPQIQLTIRADVDAEKSLTLLYWQSPQSFNPHLGSANRDWQAARITYEPLATFDKEGQLIPFLAAEIPSIENGSLDPEGNFVIWTLKEDVVWSDGEPFTADDVKFTYDYIVNPDVNSPSKNIYDNLIDSVEVIDDYTVQINFKEPNVTNWVTPFIGLRGMIIPEHIFHEYTGENAVEAPIDLAVGTGPYRIVSYRPEETLFLGNEIIQTIRVVYEPNENFRDGRPYFDQLILSGGSTVNEAARQVLQTGEADYAWNLQLTAEELAQYEGAGDVVPNFGGRVERLLLNRSDHRTVSGGQFSNKDVPNPFFEDIRVRQAIALAIDREAIAELYGPTGQTTSNILVAPANYASPNTTFTYDPAPAMELLEAAGWVDEDGDGIREKDGVSLELTAMTSNIDIRQKGLEIIKDNLDDIGIHVDIKLVDPSIFAVQSNPNSIWQFPADLMELFTGNNSPEPTSYMQRWTVQQIPQEENGWSAGWNLERFQNEEYEALFEAVGMTSEPAEREQLFIAMNDLLVNDVVTIPLVNIATAAAVSSDLQGVDLTPWDADTWNIKDWKWEAP